MTSCGCLAPSRWQCLTCAERRKTFLACSRRCLAVHGSRRHGAELREDVLSRARRKLAEANRAHAGNRELYAGHRQRLCRLLTAVQRGPGLCVLGAGNGDDLDLPVLARAFGEVHLVDLDGAATDRALDGLEGATRARIRLHPGVDLSGVLADVETWADDRFPGVAAWGERTRAAAQAIAEAVGSHCDVVLSGGVISQLCVPLYEVLAARPSEWAALIDVVGRIHVAAMARLLRPGGIGVLVGDFPYGPNDGKRVASSWEDVPAAVRARLESGVLSLRKPDYLAQLVEGTPSLTDARRTEPWAWAQADGVSLAYAILFRRDGGDGEGSG